MSRLDKCPYCGRGARKIGGRVVRQPSHLAYGYGERRYRCGSCGETFIVCFPIPPKSSSGFLPSPHKGMLKVSFKEGVSGYANPVVLTASAPVPAKPAKSEAGGES